MMKRIKSICLFGLGFAGVGLVFELLLRFGGIMTPLLTIDPQRGERYLANQMCCSLFNYEGFGLAATNSQGWFGPEFHDSGDQEISLAVLGNSFIAARQVFYRHNFMSLSEEALKETHPDLHIFNFGKETMPLRESLYLKEELDSMYHPDYFVVFINIRSLGNEGRYIPYYELQNGQLSLNTDFRNKAFVKQYHNFAPLAQSSLVFLAYRAKNHLPEYKQILFDKFYTPDTTDMVVDTIRPIDEVDEAVIREFSKDPRVIFLLDIHPITKEKILNMVGNSPVIDVKPGLEQLRKQGIDPYYWKISKETGHWNHKAHQVIARTFTEEIKRIVDKE
ncbi:MAG: hypothetical protein KDD36_11140 [Flavobacteriales bacterium]|nr:hypothetical protein [Flavobacteriales bacterium]